MSATELRIRLYDFADSFSGNVEMTADEIYAGTDDPVIQRRALQWKISATAEVYQVAFGTDPLGAYTDVWAFTKQMLYFLDTGPCFAPGSELSSVSRAGFSGMTLSVDPSHLARVADNLGLPEAVEGLEIPHLLADADPQVMDRLRQTADRLIVVATDHPKGAPSAHAPIHTSPPSPRARTRALQRATAFIDAHAGEAPTIHRICKAIGSSWRTLDYAFKEHFSMTPKKYLQMVRLHGVRRELQLGGGVALIADVANRWGFWHMGQFAADYRVKFGELPSVTTGRGTRV